MKKTHPIQGYRVCRELPRVTPTDRDVTVRREENGGGGHHYVTVNCPTSWDSPTLRLTRGYSSRRRTLQDAHRLQSADRRVLKYGKGGWREEPNWWRVQIRPDADERRAVVAVREWIGLGLADARRLVRTLQTQPGTFLRVPLTYAESLAAETANERIRALLAAVGIAAWKDPR